MIAEQEEDWLEGNPEQRREEMRSKGIEFAKLYEVFIDTAQGRELLKHWKKTILDASTPVESSIQRYAKDEGVREFIRGISRQLELAQDQI